MNINDRLAEIVRQQAEASGVPGVAVGMWLDGQEYYACHGVTSIENPLPVDEATLFQFGSTGKTFTSVAIMRLVDEGKVDLDAPVRTYLPEFAVADAEASEKVTVLQLLNHTSGWAGDRLGDTLDRGDDALEKFVAGLADIEQEFPVGTGMSYNNAALSVAGRVIEAVTGKRYEDALRELVLDPLGMTNSWFFAEDVMTRRFVVGHAGEAGELTIARPWNMPRSGAPAGGITSDIRDQVKWIRFHLGDGTALDGTRVLQETSVRRMQEPTVTIRGTALGDHVGISWMLKDIDGVRQVSHGGSTLGQQSAFEMVPERDFGIAVLTNGSNVGSVFNHAVVEAALVEFAGVQESEPVVTDRDEAGLAPYVGRYETVAMTIDVTAEGGGLSADMRVKPSFLEALGATEEEFAQPPVPLGMIGDSDAFVGTEGSSKGMKGAFFRADDETVRGVHMGGRYAKKTG